AAPKRHTGPEEQGGRDQAAASNDETEYVVRIDDVHIEVDAPRELERQPLRRDAEERIFEANRHCLGQQVLPQLVRAVPLEGLIEALFDHRTGTLEVRDEVVRARGEESEYERRAKAPRSAVEQDSDEKNAQPSRPVR